MNMIKKAKGRCIKGRTAAFKLYVLILVISLFLPTATVRAEFDWLEDPQTTPGAFDRPKEVIETSSASLYGVVFNGCMAVMVIDAVVIGVCIAMLRDKQKRAMRKTQIIRFLVAGIIMFGITSFIMALAANIGNSLSS